MDTYIIHTSEIQLITMLLRNDTCMHMQHHKSHLPGNQSHLSTFGYDHAWSYYHADSNADSTRSSMLYFSTIGHIWSANITFKMENLSLYKIHGIWLGSRNSKSRLNSRLNQPGHRFWSFGAMTGPYAILTSKSVTDLTSGRSPEVFPFGIVYGKSWLIISCQLLHKSIFGLETWAPVLSIREKAVQLRGKRKIRENLKNNCTTYHSTKCLTEVSSSVDSLAHRRNLINTLLSLIGISTFVVKIYWRSTNRFSQLEPCLSNTRPIRSEQTCISLDEMLLKMLESWGKKVSVYK